MQTKHWLIIAALLASLGAMIGSLDTWAEALKPLFIGGLLGAIATHLVAIFTETAASTGQQTVSRDTLNKIGSALLVATVSLSLLTGATCHGKQSPRHDATMNLSALTSSLRALQDGEQALYKAQTIPSLTPDAHKAFNGKMVQVWDAMSSAVSVVQAWRPGEPVPAQLAALIEATRVAVENAATVFGTAVPQKIADVWKALADLLLQTLGGVQ